MFRVCLEECNEIRNNLLLLPPGQGFVQELNTSYTIFEHLLANLAENRFSGYLRLIFWGYEGVIVYDTGKMIQAFSSDPELNLSGATAVYRIIQKAWEKEGNLLVNPLENETALALGIALAAASSNDFRTMNRKSLSEIMSLMSGEEFTGYMDLEFGREKGTGTIFFLDGNPMETVIKSAGGKIVSGEAVFQKFQRLAENLHPRITIHRVIHPDLIVEDKAFIIPWQHRKEIKFWDELFKFFAVFFDRKLLKEPFPQILKRQMSALSARFPLLDPQKKDIDIENSAFRIQHLVARAKFEEAVIQLLSTFRESIPPRKRKKIRIQEIFRFAEKLTKGLDDTLTGSEFSDLLQKAFKDYGRD